MPSIIAHRIAMCEPGLRGEYLKSSIRLQVEYLV